MKRFFRLCPLCKKLSRKKKAGRFVEVWNNTPVYVTHNYYVCRDTECNCSFYGNEEAVYIDKQIQETLYGGV